MAKGGWLQAGMVGALTFVVGFTAGGAPARSEVAALEAEVADLKRQAARRGSQREFTRLLTEGVVDAGRAARPGPAPDATPPEGGEAEEGVLMEPSPNEPLDAEPLQILDEGPPDTDAEAGSSEPYDFSDEKLAIEARRAQARASLLDHAQPDDAQMAEIDEAAAQMNDELYAMAEEVAAMVQDGHEPTRRDMMKMSVDALDALVRAEDTMLASLSADQVAALPEEATDPTAWLDPTVLDVFAELEVNE